MNREQLRDEFQHKIAMKSADYHRWLEQKIIDMENKIKEGVDEDIS